MRSLATKPRGDPTTDNYVAVGGFFDDPKGFQNTGQGYWQDDDIAATVRTPDGGDSLHSNVVGFIHPRQLRNSQSSNQVGIKPDADISDALTSEGPGAVSFEPRYYADTRQKPGGAPSETVATLTHSPKAGDTSPHMANGMQVRRLTPKECERLQGYPDDWTKINEKSADSHRYRMIGNGFAVPVVAWIGQRIAMVEELLKS